MRNLDHSPTILHYALSEVGGSWVLSCENMPVACFETLVAARRAAATYVAAAKLRGDCALLETDDAA